MTMMDTATDTLEQPSREDLERAAEIRLKVKAGLSVPREDLEHAAHVRLLLKARTPQAPAAPATTTPAANPVWGQLAAQAARDAPQAAQDATAAFQGRFGVPEQEVPPSPSNVSLGGPAGQREFGNIDLTNRPRVRNPDGSISTVRSISVGTDRGEVLIPTVSDDGRLLSNDEAIQEYAQTGRHLGIFDSPENATAYAQRLHEQQAEALNQPQPQPRGILGEAQNAFQAGAQGIEAGIGRAGAAVGDVAGRLGYHGLEGQLSQGRSGGILTPAGAPSVLPDDTNPFYAAAYKGTRLVAGAAPALAAGMVAGPLAGGGLSGLLAGASPMALQAGGDTYQQAKDAGLPMQTALGSGLAAAAVGELVGTTQLGTILRQFPGLGVGVQNLAQKRIAAYLAERGAEATFNGAVGVAQQAANDAIHVASGINPDAFEKFWSEQAPEAFAGGALPTAVAGAVHDAAALPGAIGAQRQQADLQRAQAGATDAARTLAPGYAPTVQPRVEGPTPPIQRTTPPPGAVGPTAFEPQAVGTPDQPAARAAGNTGGDGTTTARDVQSPGTPQDHLQSAFAAAEALRNRLATVLGVEPTPTPPAPAESGRPAPPAESQAQTAPPVPTQANPGEPPTSSTTKFSPRPPQPVREPARPDLGSSRLQIPMTVVPPEQRRADAVNRAGVRDATNRILNPPTKGYSTEGSLTPEDITPQEKGPRRSFLRKDQPSRRSFLRPREEPAASATAEASPPVEGHPSPAAGAEGRTSPQPPERAGSTEQQGERASGEASGKDTSVPGGTAEKQPWEMTAAEFKRAQNQPMVDAMLKSGIRKDPRGIRLTPNGDVQVMGKNGKWIFLTQPKVDEMARQAGYDVPPPESRVYHRAEVEKAIEDGKPVPPEVLADYPDLKPPEPNPAHRGPAKRSEARTPTERQPWSRSDLEARIAREHSNSAKTQAEAAQQHIEDTSSNAGDFSQAHRFKGPIPADLEPYLEGRPDLRKMLQPNAIGRGRSGEDHLAELGADEYIRRLEGDRRKRTKDQVKDLHADPSNPQGQMLADLYVTHKGKESAPKESLKPEDIAEPGTTWTVDGRPARVMKQKGDLMVQIKGLGEYPLAALDEIPADRGSLKKAGKLAAAETKLGDLADQALQRVKKGPGIKRGRNTGAEIITSKLVDLATYLGLKAAQTGVRGARVTIEAARAALDRFTGHGKYGDEEAQRAVRMGNALLRRSKNKFGGIDPARLEANIGKAYEVAQRAERRAAKRAPGPGDTRPDSQGAVDAAVALERQSADVRVGMAQRAGANKARALREAMSEQARGAREEMAQERRQARDRLIDATTTLKAKALALSYAAAERAGEAGSKETAKELKAFGREAAKIVLTNLPRSERGRSVIIRAIRGATRVKDIQRLIDEVQHRAVSARAAEAWKIIKRQTKREKIAALPEKAESIPGIPDGTNVRAQVRQLLEEAKAARQTASNMKAQPVALAKYLRARAQWMVLAKDPTTTVAARQTARAKLREIRERLLDTRPDLAPKVAAAARLKEIGTQIKEAAHLVKHADDVYVANERRSARWMRKNTTARMELAPPLADDSAETVPGISDGSKQFLGKALVFHTFTPDTMGQWMDNALGKPDVANFAHHLLYKLPLQAKARVAEEQIKRLADLDALAKKHGFDDFDHARAVISGHLGGGLQETVPIDVPGWPDKKITMGEALKIMGDDQDAQTRALSDDGMVHRLNRRRNGNTTTLGPDERAEIIAAIPKRFRDFYTEMKDLKEKSLGLRALELRRKIKGTAPDSVPMREPRLREADSDYVTDLFDKKGQSGSLLEQSFMKDRSQTPGPVNLIVDGLESHMHDWDAQLHMIHHVELAQAIGKTLLHKDTLKALATYGGDAAVKRLQTTVDRLMGTEVKMKPTAVDSVAKALKKNVGAGMTGLSPRTFVKQFSTMPLLAGLYPKDFLPALKGLTKKGLRERVMAANGLLAQRMHMADAAKAASSGGSNPIVDTGDIKLRWNAAKGNLAHAREQLGKGQIRNAAANARRAAGNARDLLFNSIRLNSWADEQGVKLAFLIQEQQVNREHPNLNAAEREKMIGERTAEVVHRTMNTYDQLGQAFWRSDLDQSPTAGVLNMFSNDSTKQANLLLQAGASGDKKLMARTAMGIAGSMAVSVLAPFALLALGNKTMRATLGASDTEEERNKNLRSKLLAAAGREVIGKAPIPFADTLYDFTKAMATGQGDVNAADNPVTTSVSTFAREMALAIYHGAKLATAEDDPDKTWVQNFEAQQERISRATSALWASARSGGTLAGVGVMPVINLLRSMTPQREPYGLAAEAAKAGKDSRASSVLAERVAAMRKAGLEDPDIKEHLITTLTNRLNRGVAKDDRQTRQENARLARSIVAGAM